MKAKICIVADVPNWAFDHVAQNIKRKLSYKYDIEIAYFNRRTEADNFFEFIESVKEYDLVHFLNRRMLLLTSTDVFREKVENSGFVFSDYVKGMKSKFTTSVCDYIDIDEQGIREHAPIFNEYTKAYYTVSKGLFDIYSSISEFKKPSCMVHDICDETLYVPMNLARFSYDKIVDREIVVGWVGNSVHSGEQGVDLKGFRTILKPVITELISEGYKFKEHYADRNDVWRLAAEMPQYYSEIDVCVCVSVHEGTPLPILESMHSGVPVISTNVGVVSEALGVKQSKFNIGDRDDGNNDEVVRKRLRECLLSLYNNTQLFEELSSENLEIIKEFDGQKNVGVLENFFDKCLEMR